MIRGQDIEIMCERLVTSGAGMIFLKGQIRGRAFRDKWGSASSGLRCLWGALEVLVIQHLTLPATETMEQCL